MIPDLQHAHGPRETQNEAGAVRPARLLPVTVAVSMVMALSLPALGVSYKATDIKSPDGIQAGDRWGERTDTANLTCAGVGGDDVNDVVVGVFNHDADVDGDGTVEEDVGRVYALDGETLPGDPNDDTDMPATLWRADLPVGTGAEQLDEADDNDHFGFYIAAVGDVTGGCEDDIAIGARDVDVDVDGDGTDESGVGKAWIFDGADGSMAYELTNPDEQAGQRFGARLGVAGDQNGDGEPDVIVGAPTTDVDGESNIGRAYVNDGTDGSHLFKLENPDGPNPTTAGDDPADDQVGPQFGKSVQGVGDLGSIENEEATTTKDETTDLYVNAFRYSENVGDVDGDGDDEIAERGRSYVFSGGDDIDNDNVLDEQELLTKLDSPEPQQSADSAYDETNDAFIQTSARFGVQEIKDDEPGDINGDDTPDLYGASFRQDVVDDPDASDDDDSCHDPTKSRCNENEGKSWTFDGAASIDETSPSDGLHGETLYQMTDPKNDQPGSQFGWSMSVTDFPEDTHDAPDLYIGQWPHQFEEGGPLGGNGGTYIFHGEDEEPLQKDEAAAAHKNLELPSKCQQSGAEFGRSVSTLQDVDTDGEDDYIAGAPGVDLPSEGDTVDAGILIFFGSDSKKDIDDCEPS